MHRKIVEDIAKPNMFAQDSGAQIAQTRRAINRVPFDIELALVRGHETLTHSFQRCPLQHLIREHDFKARKYREQIHQKTNASNIKFCRYYALKIGDRVKSKTVKEAMRNIDAEEIEIECSKRKVKCDWDCIDVRARNAFSNKLVTSSIIKYASRVNHCGLRNEMIYKTTNKCPRCNCVETWDHVVRCKKLRTSKSIYCRPAERSNGHKD